MLHGREALRKLVLNLASGLAPLARPILGGIGAILMLHRVTVDPDRARGFNRHLAITPEFLDRLIGTLKADGYEFVTIDEALVRLRHGRGGRRFTSITADDGYRDNLMEALPVLEAHGVPITIYIAPGLLDVTAFPWWELVEEIVARSKIVRVPTTDGDVTLNAQDDPVGANAWLHDHLRKGLAEHDRHAFLSALAEAHGVGAAALSRAAFMDWAEIERISRHPLVTIGAHTVHHYNLKRLQADEALREMVEAADILEARLGARPRHMAYPYGYRSAVGCREVKLAAEAGFTSAVTTRHGLIQPQHESHPHALPRISINGRYQQLGYIRTMLSGVITPLANPGRLVVTV
ncbi:polysaccharide deacetylase family protein [Pseudaminobacter sp. 19-2017]|uniref:Chitooligosaccharide deacetylase n=1 Tax=Pseudaminobacter soli (ex Zhang et al. 2022) TaxID=2831468 RepID=A0A942DZ34_9HYPH|nr:polysaccharide deacetylase family protein [Pseudaminobacter soli]MBS3647580.1 polysaccharide deacetylase family protein [Pseudaminobacter soli]